jgi:DNA-binding NtrC family response regulator
MKAFGRCILVIDDETQVLHSMRHMLEGYGSEVLVAESARDALKVIALSDIPPDIVISDYRLADNRIGVDAIEAVRESLDKSIPAIIITGDTSPERLKEVKETGLQLLHKPVSPNELHDVVQSMLVEAEAGKRSPDDDSMVDEITRVGVS